MATKMGNHDYTEASYIVLVSHKRGAGLLDEAERGECKPRGRGFGQRNIKKINLPRSLNIHY